MILILFLFFFSIKLIIWKIKTVKKNHNATEWKGVSYLKNISFARSESDRKNFNYAVQDIVNVDK